MASDGVFESWSPTPVGKLLTGVPPWTLSIFGNTYRLQVAEKSRSGAVLELRELRVVPGLLWAAIGLDAKGGSLKLNGFPNSRANDMADVVLRNLGANR